MARRKNYFSFLDFNYADGAIDLFQNTIRGAFEFDALTGDVFQAVVLTEPTPIVKDIGSLTSVTARSFGSDGNNQKFSFRVRILGSNSPHQFLPDPCDLADSTSDFTSDKIFNLIQSHTQVILYDNSTERRPKTGDVVNIKLERTGHSYNLARAKQYIGIAQDVDPLKVSSVGRPECDNLADLFKDGSIRSISTSLTPPKSTNDFFNLIKEHPAFSGFSENFLWGLVANASAESALINPRGGDPESSIGKRRYPPITDPDESDPRLKKCSWGYWQLNVCSEHKSATEPSEGDNFFKTFINDIAINTEREAAANENRPLSLAIETSMRVIITNEENQFNYVAGRMQELFASDWDSTTVTAGAAAAMITENFERPSNRVEKGKIRGRLAEEMAAAYTPPAGSGTP
jgi:hypothetical protein